MFVCVFFVLRTCARSHMIAVQVSVNVCLLVVSIVNPLDNFIFETSLFLSMKAFVQYGAGVVKVLFNCYYYCISLLLMCMTTTEEMY